MTSRIKMIAESPDPPKKTHRLNFVRPVMAISSTYPVNPDGDEVLGGFEYDTNKQASRSRIAQVRYDYFAWRRL